MITKEEIDTMIFEAQAKVHDLVKEIEEKEEDSGEESETIE